MSGKTMHMMMVAAALALAACQQQPQKPAQTEAPAPKPAASTAMIAKPAAPVVTTPAPAPKPTASTVMTAKPVAPAPKPPVTAPEPAPKPAPSAAMTAKPAPAPQPVAESPATPSFSTMKCMACHAIDHDKVGPAWKTVVKKYGDAATLAKDFESGFKERRVANAIAKWKPKEGLMTMQYRNLIKGHEKEAAHALFMTVKNGKFGSY